MCTQFSTGKTVFTIKHLGESIQTPLDCPSYMHCYENVSNLKWHVLLLMLSNVHCRSCYKHQALSQRNSIQLSMISIPTSMNKLHIPKASHNLWHPSTVYLRDFLDYPPPTNNELFCIASSLNINSLGPELCDLQVSICVLKSSLQAKV